MNINNAEENGHAVRLSVLTVGTRSQPAAMLSVACHNGISLLAEEIQYHPSIAGI